MAIFGFIGGILFLIFGLIQMYLGVLGIAHHLGGIAAIFALGAALGLRIMLPLTIGTFFGALNVMGWPWYGAIAIAAPGLFFIAPSMVTALLATLFNKK